MATTRRPKYRSGLERLAAGCIVRAGLTDFKYEAETISYLIPPRKARYLPDWKMDNIILETKGRFTSSDRKKMLLLKEQHPDKTFIMIFGAPMNRIAKKSSTTYAAWCDKNNIPWCDIADFEEDPITCLSSIIPNFRGGKSKTARQKNKKLSSQ